MAFKKEAFKICGLFPTKTGYHRGPMAEDLYFSMLVKMKTKRRILFNPKIVVLHKVNFQARNWKFMAERARWIGYSRRMLKTLFSKADGNILNLEYELLKRTLFAIFTCVFKTLFKSPAKLLQTLSIITLVMFALVLGFSSRDFVRKI